MANNYIQATIQPDIPKDLVTTRLMELAAQLDINYEVDPSGAHYFFNSDWVGSDNGVDEQDFYDELQQIIKLSRGRIKYFQVEMAFTCDRMKSGEFGGSAVFITREEIKFMATSQWLSERIAEVSP